MAATGQRVPETSQKQPNLSRSCPTTVVRSAPVRGAKSPAAGLLAVVCLGLLSLLGAAGSRADPAPALRQRAADLQAQEHATLLSLFSLDSQVDASGAELAGIRARLAGLRRDQADARLQLRIARKTLAVAQRRLGRTLVALYEDTSADPIAVLLGATTFAEAVDGLDNLTRIAASHQAVARQATTARRRISRFSRTLAARAAETRRLEAAAEAKRAELERVRAERSAYLARVRAESTQVADRIAVVEAEARAAEARAVEATTQATAAGSTTSFAAVPRPEPAATAPQPAPPPPPAPEPVPPAPAVAEPAPIQAPPSGSHTMTVTATAYSGGGSTATGLPVGYGVAAVDPTVIPLGTRMTIPGYGEAVAADTGSGVRGAWVDVWLPTQAQAEAWGTQTLTITIH
jgi:3D (Asp-Asp-Asp) domain-containing protein/peptidoglycan hydrolase CwlO-like protein